MLYHRIIIDNFFFSAWATAEMCANFQKEKRKTQSLVANFLFDKLSVYVFVNWYGAFSLLIGTLKSYVELKNL